MLLRDTLRSVLASPGAPEAADDEVRRLFRPAWRKGFPSHALVLTGVRRSGKSTLQHQIRRELGGASVVLNLEDPRLYGLGAEDFAFLSRTPAAPGGPSLPPGLTLQQMEKEYVEATLDRLQGNVKAAAEALGIDRPTLYDKIKRYEIPR